MKKIILTIFFFMGSVVVSFALATAGLPNIVDGVPNIYIFIWLFRLFLSVIYLVTLVSLIFLTSSFFMFLITKREKIELKNLYAKKVGYLAIALSCICFIHIFIDFFNYILPSPFGMTPAYGGYIDFNLFNIFVLLPLYIFVLRKYIWVRSEASSSRTISIKGMWYSVITLVILVSIWFGERPVLEPILKKLFPSLTNQIRIPSVPLSPSSL